MNVYITMLAIILAAAYIFRGEKNRNTFLLISFFALFFIMGFRHAAVVGVDAATSYLANFKEMNNTTPKFETNFAFFYLMKFVYIITKGNYHLFVIFESAFVIYSYYHLTKKYSTSPLISILWFLGLGYYTFLFSAMKQAFAMAILCFAFDAIMEKKPVKFIIFVAIASCFHLPALIFLPAYWIAKMNVGKTYFILLGSIMAFVYLFRSQILNFLLSGYEGENAEMASAEAGFLTTKVIIMLVIAVIAFAMRVPDEKDRLYSVLLMFVGISIVLQTFSGYNNIFERLADYYFVFSILFISMPFENKGEQKSLVSENARGTINVGAILVILLFCIWRFNSLVSSGYSYLLPYKFCWQPL